MISFTFSFKGVSGRNGFEANLSSITGSFVNGEIIYQRNNPDPTNASNYTNGILVDNDNSGPPKKIKVMMNSTGSFVNSTDSLWGATSTEAAVINNANAVGKKLQDDIKQLIQKV